MNPIDHTSKTAKILFLFPCLALFGPAFFVPIDCSASMEDGWEGRISAAYHPVSVDLHTVVKGQSASFSSNSGDFMSLDNSGVRVRVEAWKGRLGLTADNVISYFNAQSRSDSATTVTLKGYDMSTALGASYIVGSLPISSESKIDFEAMGGGRFVLLKQTLEYDPGNDVSDRKAYVDPYLGSRITWKFNKMWSFDVLGNIGGFGIGNASEMTWYVAPKFNLSVSDSFLINMGYQAFDVLTEKETGAERTQLDGRIYGPFAGVEFRFATGE